MIITIFNFLIYNVQQKKEITKKESEGIHLTEKSKNIYSALRSVKFTDGLK